jgi:hypothetical protein
LHLLPGFFFCVAYDDDGERGALFGGVFLVSFHLLA